VSLMPCTAKKYEAEDVGDVDYVLTTRELDSLWKRFGIDFDTFEERQPLDPPFAEATGAARLFASTGGVMEAAVRTAATLVGADEPAGPLVEARGLEGVKRFNLDVGGLSLNLAVVNGLGHLRPLLDDALSGLHFVEVMSCPGGCAGGGGQPYGTELEDLRKRQERLYEADAQAEVRSSHQNKSLAALYEEYLGRPLSDVSHRLLHRHYTDRSATVLMNDEPGAPEPACVAAN
ncbi:MAG: iron hydrogenase small subunit, partial [Thermoleophilia bacterium]|nr:iron hydrogenase small subunit [Thermoleophilia bacterium]